MANWKNLNLDAPEFVPKFGGSPTGQQNQAPNQFQPPQQQQQQYFAQQPNSQQQQQFYQQQQFRQPHPQQQNFPQQFQQQQQPPFYYQQQQQQPLASSSQQPAPQNQQAQPAANPQSDKQMNQLTNNLNKLTTDTSDNKSNDSKPVAQTKPTEPTVATPTVATPTVATPTVATPTVATPTVATPTVATPTVATPTVATPTVTPPVQTETKTDVVTPSQVVLDPSLIEKSEKPSVAPIKEDEEWVEEDGDEEGEGEGEGGDAVAGEAAKAKKKKLVIREYKLKKEPINVIFCGHVDAGKSTIGGQIMYLTGMVDKRTLEKYEREAKEKNRESWYLSWALDTNLEEREKGKTVEVGRAFFETDKKHFIILDAPGHKGFVPNMIGGASQADIAVLVISARRGEFETGFERGGQTREHAMLVKTAGVKYLIVLVNKMDDSTVNWDPTRYEEIKEKLTPYLKKCGFQPGKDTYFMPCSGFTGAFIKDPVDDSICDWYKGPCFIEYLESLPTINRTTGGPLRMPIIDKYKDMGTVVMGKIESGMIKLNDKLVVMPNKVKVEVTNIYCEDDETDSAICGENVKLKLRGVEEEEISSGFVLCDLKDNCQVAKVFDAQVIILDCPTIICPGFNSIMHLHAATVEVQLKVIIGMVDKKSGEKDLKNRPRFIKQDQIAICRFEILNSMVACMEPFKIAPQLGRFTLRCESKTVAVGKVLKVIE